MAFSYLLMVVIAAIAVTIFAERRGIQAPLLLALVGIGASFIPGLPRLELEPEIILDLEQALLANWEPERLSSER